jgi:uncharacterized protein (DUF2384 family)
MAANAFEVFVDSLKDPAAPMLSPQRFAAALHIGTQELADVARVHRNTLRVSPAAPRLQSSMRGILRVMSAAASFGRTNDEVIYWLTNHPIAALGHKTAWDLVAEGKAQAVVDYLESIESGFVG